MTEKYYLVQHKIFNLTDFYTKSRNFDEPPNFQLKTAFDCGSFIGFSIYTDPDGDSVVSDLQTYLDNKYGATAVNLIYEISKETSGGWMNFQTIEELKQRANDA